MTPQQIILIVKLAISAISLISIYFIGHNQGAHSVQIKLDSYIAKIEDAAKRQQIASLEKDAQHETNALQINSDLAAVRAQLARLRNAAIMPGETSMQMADNGSGAMPKTTIDTGTAYGAIKEQQGACTSTFYENALDDALRLQMWQELAIKNEWIVR